MKNRFKIMFLSVSILTLAACKKDEGNLPTISFKTGGAYISSDVSKSKGSALVFGINAEKAEKKDVLKKFNISKSINGGTSVSVYDQDLTGGDADKYTYDYSATLDTIVGQTCKYTFTVTNRDGLVNQVSSTVTITQ